MSFRLNREVLLGDVCVLGDGAHTKVKRVNEGIPYLTSKNIKNGNIDYNNTDYMSNVDYEKLFGKSNKSIRSLEVGDILIGIIGTLGNSYIYKETDKFGISSSVGIIRAKEELINFKYLYYCINSNRFKSYTEMFKGGSVQGYTNLPTLRKIPIYLPTLEEQKAIAKILSDLDEKIETNNKINKNLEEMAQAIFKQWFVDFEFSNEEGKPYKSSGGEMVESELGMIPKGWKVYKLGDFIKFIKGKKPKKIEEKYFEKSKMYLTIDVLNRNSQIFASSEKAIEADDKDILMVMDGASSGTLYYGMHGIVGSTLSKISILNEIDKNLIYYYLKINENDIKAHLTGSAIPHTDKEFINRLNICICSDKFILDKANKIFEYTRMQVINLNNENERLEKFRDTLLPKLMSGEIRISLK